MKIALTCHFRSELASQAFAARHDHPVYTTSDDSTAAETQTEEAASRGDYRSTEPGSEASLIMSQSLTCRLLATQCGAKARS